MLPKRNEQSSFETARANDLSPYQAALAAIDTHHEKEAPAKKDEESISIFWRVFGGAILSIVALISITLFNNMSSSISELRAGLANEREARAELVKKEEFNTRVSSQYERIRGLDSLKVELEGLKEKIRSNGETVEAVKRDTTAAVEAVKRDTTLNADAMKKDAAALDVLKERVVTLEGLKKEVAAIEAIRERLASVVIDLKTVRDDVQKTTAEVERNKNSDLERKTFRDAQNKQIEESLKELQKGMQDIREKLVRLEAVQPKPPVDNTPRVPPETNTPKPPTAPATPAPFAKPTEANPTKQFLWFTLPTLPTRPSESKPSGGVIEPGIAKPLPGSEK